MRPRLDVTMEWMMQRVSIQANGCWQWMGSKNDKGYGTIMGTSLKPPRTHTKAHRAMWELQYGPVPDGLKVLHHCDNPGCVNPDHLFFGTCADNTHDMMRKGRESKPPTFYGEKHHAHKLTWAQVEEIREAVTSGQKQIAVARRYGVSSQVVNHIVRGKIWQHR